MSGLMDNGLHRVFSIYETFIVPLFLAGIKDRFKVSDLISLSQVLAFCLRQFKLRAPQLNLHLG